MLSQGNVRSTVRSTEQVFNVIEEFAALSNKRKIQLCNALASGSEDSFKNTAKLIWPDIQAIDINKLEKFVFLLNATAH